MLQKKISIKNSEKKTTFECELIKTDNYYFGKIIFEESFDWLIFYETEIDLNDETKESKYIFLLSYFLQKEQEKTFRKKIDEKYLKKRNEKKKVLIIFNEIEEIVERRTLLMWKSVEIFLKNGKSYFFNFLNTSEFENFIKYFRNNDTLKNLIRKKDFFNTGKSISDDWERGLINNYEYILLLNKYSSRSFNDANEYPVFPWLLLKYENLESFNKKENKYEDALIENIKIKNEIDEFYKNKKNKDKNITINNDNKIKYEKIEKEVKEYLRNFKYPSSLQYKEKRENAISKFEDEDENESFSTHSGCHYSTSAYIYYYLMRQQPYCNLLVKLQSYNLESTNRVFISISTVELVRDSGNDNRELIPEFFSKIEYFLNLNCDHYGYLNNTHIIVDDAKVDIFKKGPLIINTKYPISKYIHFILEHKKLLNSKIIGFYINKWIDNIFGVNQLPPANIRKKSCNIFQKYSYEQEVNLEGLLKESINKKDNSSNKEIKVELNYTINCILNFGQTPHQIFNEPHHELDLKVNKIINENSDSKDLIDLDNEDDEDYDFESMISTSIREQNLSYQFKGKPIYFEICDNINKILIYNINGNIIILDCQLFNKVDSSHFNILLCPFSIEKSNIFVYGKKNLKYEYLAYKIKYSLSSFNEIESYNQNINETNYFHTYYTDIINDIQQKEKFTGKIKNLKNKIKEKKNKNKNKNKIKIKR